MVSADTFGDSASAEGEGLDLNGIDAARVSVRDGDK